MIKVVLDTNVLVSSLLTLGPPAAIADLVADGKIIPFYNNLIFREYWDVLTRKKFGFSPAEVNHLINNIERTGMAVENEQPSTIPMIDEEDRVFFDAALKAKAFLITGNTRHFPRRSFVVTPAQFIFIYQKADT